MLNRTLLLRQIGRTSSFRTQGLLARLENYRPNENRVEFGVERDDRGYLITVSSVASDGVVERTAVVSPERVALIDDHLHRTNPGLFDPSKMEPLS